MSLGNLPSDILNIIGLYLDWETIHTCFRLLNKKINQLCRTEFWRLKCRQDYLSKMKKPPHEFYPNSFYHYLAIRSRWLIKRTYSLLPIITEQKKEISLNVKIWYHIFSMELYNIQKILCDYLKKEHSLAFQCHVLDLADLSDGPLPLKFLERHKINQYNLLIQDEVDQAYNDLVDQEHTIGFVETSTNVKLSEIHPVDSFYNFLWSLGLDIDNINMLYEESYVRPYKTGHYLFKLATKLDFGPFTEFLIKRYFKTKENYEKCLKFHSKSINLFD